MAEMQNKTKREMLNERLLGKYPDMDLTDDEVMMGRIGDDYDEYERDINRYKDNEKKLTDLFSKDPRSAQFITDMANGKDPMVMLLESMGIDGITDILNDPEKKDAYAKANQEYLDRVSNNSKLMEENKVNFPESMKLLDAIQAERNLDDETVDKAFDLIMKMYNEVVTGKFTRETFEMALNAVTHDADVTNARSEGNVAGRNARIEEMKRSANKGDGMPQLGGSNNAPAVGGRAKNMFDLAAEAR